jgi:hypothetical protein
VPVVNVLSKCDLLKEEELAKIERWTDEADTLMADLEEELPSTSKLLSMELLKALEAMGVYRKLVPASATEMTGLEDVYSAAQLVYTGGEDLSSD